MSRHFRRIARSGFTFVELLIVVVVVGILASVALVLFRDTTKQAYLSEADAALGTIRLRMRNTLLTGKTNYTDLMKKYSPGIALKVIDMTELQVAPVDLDGRFFDHNAYRMYELKPNRYLIAAIGDSSQTPYREAITGLIRTMDQDGTLKTTTGLPK